MYSAGRNGVVIVLTKDLKDSLVGVNRRRDGVISVKLAFNQTVVNVICAYASQVGCGEKNKEAF